MTGIHLENSAESNIKSALLVMLLSHPPQFFSKIPADWSHFVHMDMDESFDPKQLRPMLECLVGHFVSTGRVPIDYCAVKSATVRSIVIRTAPKGDHSASLKDG